MISRRGGILLEFQGVVICVKGLIVFRQSFAFICMLLDLAFQLFFLQSVSSQLLGKLDLLFFVQPHLFFVGVVV